MLLSRGSSGGSAPAFMHAEMNAALVPKHVMPASAAKSHIRCGSGMPS